MKTSMALGQSWEGLGVSFMLSILPGKAHVSFNICLFFVLRGARQACTTELQHSASAFSPHGRTLKREQSKRVWRPNRKIPFWLYVFQGEGPMYPNLAPTQFEAEAKFELLISCLYFPSPEVTGICYHALFMCCWGANPGLHARQVLAQQCHGPSVLMGQNSIKMKVF